ncbi:hypothetical protein ES703_113809 [subsurface metagenome]
MSIFNSGFFWFSEGVLTCIAVIALKLWMEDKNIPMPWWKWLLTAFWICFIGMGIAYVATSLGEGERQAAFMGAVLVFASALISGVVLWRLLKLR